MKSLNDIAAEIHAAAKSRGFYDKPPSPLESHMLMVSEIAEATETIRNRTHDYFLDRNGKPHGELAELVDALMRILDWCHYRGYDINQALGDKMEYNRQRPYMHGKTI